MTFLIILFSVFFFSFNKGYCALEYMMDNASLFSANIRNIGRKWVDQCLPYRTYHYLIAQC